MVKIYVQFNEYVNHGWTKMDKNEQFLQKSKVVNPIEI
jgi:hypothetical protein